ncbi:UTP--glucose-1-phosphate uridylyltransferase GalU [Alicyclobacillus fastidiosus]|uniref:UTP--glucose-1-phosphate uridylyltransferase n=1 Tax=Alicyclobacillus fastidiosus TaxID=392011 RepID=A0ABY6ZAJ5_9BACL|nr:UTP--glucose-1-phosphate uridylyltransferase GalU [Alicyclobacillus fastidiosus]WAH39886.1 UTP--glucose-1-phosphate uridylyltransferase GalU [Alicyclobacillus fastidiosus]GMA61156.1 UTP--glucose-1-phosphate uridylyltransferase [Alicyclobacillus fastidiosus]
MNKIRKVVIPAAGLGTRFLPATKAMPKEMLPLVDKPTIQYIVEEAVASGIEDIIIVTGKGKRAIEDHFDRSVELEELLTHKGKQTQLNELGDIVNMANIHYIRQKVPLGLGHAVWCARRFIGEEPFAVLLGDDIVQGERPGLRQLIDVYETYGKSVVGVKSVPVEHVSRYGIVGVDSIGPRLSRVKSLVEKPSPVLAPSTLAIIGRYVLTPNIFEYLESGHIGAGGEIQLTDALEYVNSLQGMMAYEIDGRRYDVGEKLGFIEATLELALSRPDLQSNVRNLMQRLLLEEEVTVG